MARITKSLRYSVKKLGLDLPIDGRTKEFKNYLIQNGLTKDDYISTLKEIVKFEEVRAKERGLRIDEYNNKLDRTLTRLNTRGKVTINYNEFLRIPFYSSSIYNKGSASLGSLSGNNYLGSSNFYNLVGNKSFSITLWSRRTGISNAYSVLFKIGGSSGTAGTYYLLKYNTTNNITFSNGSATLTSLGTYSDQDKWTHIAITYDATSFIATIYVNGTSSGSANLINNYSGNTDFRIMNDFTSQYYRGYIDDFQLYNRVLTSSEVSELYYGTIAIYSIPRFLLGVEVEDIDLDVDNGVNQYK